MNEIYIIHRYVLSIIMSEHAQIEIFSRITYIRARKIFFSVSFANNIILYIATANLAVLFKP